MTNRSPLRPAPGGAEGDGALLRDGGSRQRPGQGNVPDKGASSGMRGLFHRPNARSWRFDGHFGPGGSCRLRNTFLPGHLRYHPRWRHALGERLGAEPQAP